MSDEKKKYRKMASDAFDEAKRGEGITLDAAIKASERMIELLDGAPEARAKAIEELGLYVGIGTMFMEKVAPRALSMKDDLPELTGDKDQAKMLTGIWLGIVFKDIERQLAKLNK